MQVKPSDAVLTALAALEAQRANARAGQRASQQSSSASDTTSKAAQRSAATAATLETSFAVQPAGSGNRSVSTENPGTNQQERPKRPGSLLNIVV